MEHVIPIIIRIKRSLICNRIDFQGVTWVFDFEKELIEFIHYFTCLTSIHMAENTSIGTEYQINFINNSGNQGSFMVFNDR